MSAILTNTLDGCQRELPSGGAFWESASHFRFAVFSTDILSCEATLEGGYAPYERFDFPGGSVRINMLQEWLTPCRSHQIDWQGYSPETDSWDTLDAIVLNPLLGLSESESLAYQESCGMSQASVGVSVSITPVSVTPLASIPEASMLLLTLVLLTALIWKRVSTHG